MSEGTMETRIVDIENDEQMRDLLTWHLNREGWQVLSYTYHQIDRTALVHPRPDLMILDFGHWDEGGWELLQLLKMDDTTAHIPILITTTKLHLSAEIRDYLLIRDISVVLQPFDIDTFLLHIKRILTLASQAGVLFSSDQCLPVLVVDDTEDLRDNIATLLGLEGYATTTASNGLEALEILARYDPCLILLDISMPVMNGFEFLSAYDRRLRPHTPVIILSAEQDIREHTLPAFVVDVQAKPFDFKRLLSAVGKYARPVGG
jgi:DNA-binding response OmpR family regulator